jgi:hypothetical protein
MISESLAGVRYKLTPTKKIIISATMAPKVHAVILRAFFIMPDLICDGLVE